MTGVRSTEISTWSIEAQPFLKSILDCVAQPVWVVDHDGLIRFANPAALAALGYDHLSELEGKPSHETIHYNHPDGSHYPAEECPMLRPRATGETVHADEDWFFRRDGTMFPVGYWSAPIDTPNGRGAVVAFTNIEEQRRAERAERERDIAQARATEARAAQRRIVEAGDLARRRVTRDLHDGAQQRFVNSLINLQLARDKWYSDSTRARELLEIGAEEAETGIELLRELAAGLHPTILSDLGLEAALESLADRAPIPVSIDVDELTLQRSLETSIYFVCSEALTNVIKHSSAMSASVRVGSADGWLSIEVSDDGVGGAEIGSGGSGLLGMKDRIAALEGTLELTSPQGGSGTTLTASIPLRR